MGFASCQSVLVGLWALEASRCMAPRWPKTAPRAAQDGPKTAPRAAKNAPRAPQEGPKRRFFGPRGGDLNKCSHLFLIDGLQDGPRYFKMTEDCPRRASKRPQDGPKTVSRALRALQGLPPPARGQTGSKTWGNQCLLRSCFFASDGLLRPQDGPKMAQERPKRGPRGPQDGPKSAQERPKTAPRRPF